MNGEETYDVRVLPLVKKVIDEDSGKTNIVENLSRIEIKEMSCEPRMLHRNNKGTFFMELPPTYHDTRIKWTLFYLYDDLNNEEQVKYYDRTECIPVTSLTVLELSKKKIRKKK